MVDQQHTRIPQLGLLIVILCSVLVAFVAYPRMPERMGSHWNAQGIVDGYLSRFWGVFTLPLITLFLGVLFILIPRFDPKGKNIEEFRNYFEGFGLVIGLFLLYLYILTLLWNVGVQIHLLPLLAPAFGVLYFYIGILLEHSLMNWSIGIRTPWTLSSDSVWKKTHKFGGLLFKIAGVIAFLGYFFSAYTLLLILAPIILFAFLTIVYSYREYQRENGTKSHKNN